jgi:hypothetical protein
MLLRTAMPKRSTPSLLPADRIERAILVVRGHKVLLDMDLANLYEVETKVLNQAVRRNRDRFPADFMFQLTKAEFENWRSQVVTSIPAAADQRPKNAPSTSDTLNRSQIVTGSQKHRDPRYPPYAFTEQGVAMLSSVLRSKRAVAVNIQIMRTFVRLREMLASNAELNWRLDELEQKYDGQFRVVFDAIRQLMSPPPATPKRRIGFHVEARARK